MTAAGRDGRAEGRQGDGGERPDRSRSQAARGLGRPLIQVRPGGADGADHHRVVQEDMRGEDGPEAAVPAPGAQRAVLGEQRPEGQPDHDGGQHERHRDQRPERRPAAEPAAVQQVCPGNAERHRESRGHRGLPDGEPQDPAGTAAGPPRRPPRTGQAPAGRSVPGRSASRPGRRRRPPAPAPAAGRPAPARRSVPVPPTGLRPRSPRARRPRAHSPTDRPTPPRTAPLLHGPRRLNPAVVSELSGLSRRGVWSMGGSALHQVRPGPDPGLPVGGDVGRRHGRRVGGGRGVLLPGHR